MNEENRNLVYFILSAVLIFLISEHIFPRQHEKSNNISSNINNNINAVKLINNGQNNLNTNGGDQNVTGNNLVNPANSTIQSTTAQDSTNQTTRQSLAKTNSASSTPDILNQPIIPLEKIKIDSAQITGEFSNQGFKIANLKLKGYREKNDKNSELIQLLRNDDVFIQTYYESNEPYLELPNALTVWKVIGTDLVLKEGNSILFEWTNKDGVVFQKRYTIDAKYMLEIEDTVINNSNNECSVIFAGDIIKQKMPAEDSSMTSFEGALGYVQGKLEEIAFKDLDKKPFNAFTKGGWIGLSDKYWFTSVIPSQEENYSVNFSGGAGKKLKISSVPQKIAKQQKFSHTYKMFIGPKELSTLDMYEEKYKVKHLDLAIDFGYLYFITKPMLYCLIYVNDLIGNLGVAILILTLLLKLFMLPLANKSYKSMARMKELNPKIQEIQKRYAGDKVKLGQELSALYQKEKISPLGGCLPTLLQSPILFGLYKVLYISIEMRHAPFCLWITDLSAPDPMTILNLFGLIPFELPGFLQIGIWPILMGLSMFLQQKMSPQTVSDPAQAQMMTALPIVFTFMFGQLPSGLVIYWTFSNILSMIQQKVVTDMMVRDGVKEEGNVAKKKK